jgi:hypothetical protein
MVLGYDGAPAVPHGVFETFHDVLNSIFEITELGSFCFAATSASSVIVPQSVECQPPLPPMAPRRSGRRSSKLSSNGSTATAPVTARDSANMDRGAAKVNPEGKTV